MTPNENGLPSPENGTPDDAPQTVARGSARPAEYSAPTTTDITSAPGFGEAPPADPTDPFDAPPPLDLDVSTDDYASSYVSELVDDEPGAVEMASGFEAAEQFEEETRDKELDLMEHLGELRSRLLKSISAVGICMLLTWHFAQQLLDILSAPIVNEISRAGGKLVTGDATEGFRLYLQISLIAAIILAIPIIIYQAWAFIEPALTKKERRYGITIVPFSVVLFFTGATIGFFLTPLFFRFFLQFQPPNSVAFWSFGSAASLLGKMLLVFGICFQVPVVTIFLNKIGLLSRNWMIEYWRHVVVVMFVVVAIITPTWDPITLCAAATPPCLLYGLSIWIVKWL